MSDLTTHTGAVTLSPSGSNTVFKTVGGTAFSADTMKAVFSNGTTPTFTGNITLPATYTAPTSSQLGYTNNLTFSGVTLSTYGANTQNICGPTGTGRNIQVTVGGSYIVTWNYTVTPTNGSNPSYIYLSTNEGPTSADSLNAPRVWFPIGDSVGKSGVLTRLYSGAACTFSPICMLGNGSTMNFTYENCLEK